MEFKKGSILTHSRIKKVSVTNQVTTTEPKKTSVTSCFKLGLLA